MALFHSRLFWTQAALRAVSVALLLAILGFLIHCTVLQWRPYFQPLIFGYVVDVMLIVFNASVLKRVCARILGKVTVPGRAEAGWMFALDMVAIALAVAGGVYLMLSYERSMLCGPHGCGVVRTYPDEVSWDYAVYLLYAVGGVALLLTAVDWFQYLLTRRATPRPLKAADAQTAPHDISIRLEEPSQSYYGR